MEDENVVAAEAGGVTTEESIQLTEVPAKKSAFSSSKEATVFDLGSTPLSFTVEDRLDPAAVDLGKHKRCCVCCVEDSFPSRFWSRIKLDHVVADNSPGFVLLKIVLVCVLSLLIDKGTRNPDSVTTVLVGVIGLASYTHVGLELAKETLIGGLMGAVFGTLISAATYLPPAQDPGRWMILLSVPWSVAMTRYVMFFMNFNTPGGVAAGVFSSLFVIIVPFSYPPINDFVPMDDPRRLIWQTLLVRVLALFTGVFSAFVVNFLISASAPLAIYRTTMFFAERTIWKTQKHRMDPLDGRWQANYGAILSQIHLGPVVRNAADNWVFSEMTREEIDLILLRSKAIFRFLSFRTFLELYLDCLDSRAREREDVIALINLSMRNAAGKSERSLEEELSLIDATPDHLHVEKSVLKSILIDLKNFHVKYHLDTISPFWGRV